jgi:hypothetical protein
MSQRPRKAEFVPVGINDAEIALPHGATRGAEAGDNPAARSRSGLAAPGANGPELTKLPPGTHKQTYQEHYAARAIASRGVRSGLNPPVFSDTLC